MEKKRLKIGFDAKRLFLNHTGLGNYSRTLVSNLKANFPECEIHLFTTKSISSSQTRHFMEGEYTIHECPWYVPDFLWRTWLVSFTINSLKLDVYHGLSQELPYGIHPEIKKMVTIHDVIAVIYPKLFSWYDAMIYRFKYKSAVLRADRIIAISESTSNDIQKYYGVGKEKINVVHQTCHDVFKKDAAHGRQGNYFLFVGSIHERKGLMDIVEAMNLLQLEEELLVRIIGDGGVYKEKVMDRIKQLDLGRHFEFLGSLENAELIDIYDHCIALILPSKYEGFGIPIIESLYRARPVICYDNSSLPEATGPGGWIVPTGDIGALADAMAAALDTKMNEELGSKGREHVSRMFSGAVLSRMLYQLYSA